MESLLNIDVIYAFPEFATQSCKWGKVVRLQCKSYKFGCLVWGTTLAIWYHMFMCFLSLELWLIIKTKVIVSRNQVVKRYFTSNFTVKLLQQNIRVWLLWRLKQNISWQIGFQATIFVFINQPEVENNINTTPWATFYPKPETNFTGFNMVQSLQFCPTYKKMALWSPKRCILRHD